MRKRRRRTSLLRRLFWGFLSVVLWGSLFLAICLAFYLVRSFSVSADAALRLSLEKKMAESNTLPDGLEEK